MSFSADFEISVISRYLPNQSRPAHNHWVFAYQVSITNTGSLPAQLLSRHWIITDGMGSVEHVRGAGVVGEQPIIQPGETYRYVSGCPLPTPIGSMSGSYRMKYETGEEVDAEIEPFLLAQPDEFN